MENELSLVTFKICNELYGIDIMEVSEIIRVLDITPIPNAPSFVEGVVNLRGEIIPVVDLVKRFKFKEREFTEEEELLRGIIVVGVEDMTIGVIIGAVNRVLSVPADKLQPPPHMVSGVGAEYIRGVVRLDEALLVVLNINKLFSKQELMQLSGKF